MHDCNQLRQTLDAGNEKIIAIESWLEGIDPAMQAVIALQKDAAKRV